MYTASKILSPFNLSFSSYPLRFFLFFLFFFSSIKGFFFFRFFFEINFFVVFMVCIFPLCFSAVGSYLESEVKGGYKFLSLFTFLFFIIFSRLFFCFCSTDPIVFLFFAESSNIFLLILIYNFSKDKDKMSSSIFILIFNILGSVPFMAFLVLLPESRRLDIVLFPLHPSPFILLLLVLFCCKIPILFTHFWLTKVHVRSFGVCSIILASLLIKLGSFGLLKFVFLFSAVLRPLFFSYRLISFFIFSKYMFRSVDLKILIAFSSLAHIALIPPFLVGQVNLGSLGSLIMCVSHGLISFILFFLLTLIYEACSSRGLMIIKGFQNLRGNFKFIFILVMIINVGIPPFINFISEIIFFKDLLNISSIFCFLFFLGSLLIRLHLIFFIINRLFFKILFFHYRFKVREKDKRICYLFLSSFLLLPFVVWFHSLIKILLCGSKDYKPPFQPIFKVFSFFLLLSSLLFFFWFLGSGRSVCFELGYALTDFYNRVGLRIFNLSFSLDKTNYRFFFMLFMVSCMVLLFREVYMELRYKTSKYFFLIASFIFSMAFLLGRDRILSLCVGIDFLGLTSFFLVLFYPNRKSSFNGFLIYFYNRIRDLAIILGLGVCLYECFSHFVLAGEAKILILIAGLVKRAQLPFLSWLPAAMSAPTPVSALVHSSTLVTVGVFILFKFSRFIPMGTSRFFLLGILVGGLSAYLARDLKKVIAFSTFSQIRLILFILNQGYLFIALSHIICHAVFKSVIFASAGIIFIKEFGSQKPQFRAQVGEALRFLFLLTASSIRGLLFTLRFFTKDQFFELRLANKAFNFSTLSFFLGALLTISYCSKIWKAISNTNNYSFKFNVNFNTPKIFISVVFFMFVIAYSFNLFMGHAGEGKLISPIQTLILNFFFFFWVFQNLPLKSSRFKIITERSFFIKRMVNRIWSIYNKVLPSRLDWTRMVDRNFKFVLLGSERNTPLSKENFLLAFSDRFFWFISSVALFLCYYSFSLLERSFEAAKDLE